jgi:hypothetical protein
MKFALVNACGGRRAGDILNDAQGDAHIIAGLLQIGGLLVALPNTSVEQACANAATAYARGGGDEIANGIMLAAAGGGGGGGSPFPVLDSVFKVTGTADPTKFLTVDLSNQATTSGVTIFPSAGISRPFRLPDISGTAVVQEDTTGFVFIGATVQLHGSNSRMQLSSIISNGSQYRANQYGANTGAPGISTFKSRGATVGSLAGIIAGDVLFRATCVGVAPDNASIPLAAFITIQVPSGFVPAGQAWAPSEYELQLVPLAGPINSRRVVFKVGSEGDTQTLRGVRAGGKDTTPATIASGALWSSGLGDPNGVVTGSPGDMFTRTDGGAGTTLYVKESGVATNTGWVGK